MKSPNPIIATILRGGRVESVHRGFGAATDARGTLQARFGDCEAPVYWRSAAKPFQSMPFLEAGGESEFRLSREEIALACASHDGEPRHTETARAMLEKGGFSEKDLRCGSHAPYDEDSAAALLRAGERFNALHNNCSGKHAAMLLACRLLGFDPKTYDQPDHPLQKLIREKIAFYSLFPAADIEIAVDGCSAPVFRLPISRLAASYARLLFSGPLDLESQEAWSVRRRIVSAMTGSPFFVSGTGQFTTRFIEAGAGRWIGKEGAEGVYAIGISAPRNLGIAFKVDDGGGRPRNAVALDFLRKLGEEIPAGVADSVRPALKNVRGLSVGEIVPDVPLELVS